MYAKISDNLIIEYPITDADYEAGRYEEVDVVECFDNVKPAFVPIAEYLSESPIVINDRVLINYSVAKHTVEELLVILNEDAAVTIATVSPLMLEALIIVVKERIQGMLDGFANSRDYDNMNSAISYKTSIVTEFQTEANRCEVLRDTTWNSLNLYLTDVMTAVKPLPSVWTDIYAQLPELVW